MCKLDPSLANLIAPSQKAIKRVKANDFSEVDRLFKLLSQPFTSQLDLEKPEDLAPLPSDVPEVMVSCSS